MREGHIGALEGIALTTIILAAKETLTIPQMMVQEARTAAWLVALGSGVLALILFLLIASLMRHHPHQSLVEVTEKALGPWLALPFNLAYALSFFTIVALRLRQFVEVFVTTVLPETPPSVLAILLMVVALAIAYSGLETLARTALVLVPLVLLGTGLVLFFSLPSANLDWLFPIWGAGPGRLALGTVTWVGAWSELLLLPIIYSAFREHRTMVWTGAGGLFLATAFLTLICAIWVALAGARGGATQPFPLYQMARLIYLGRFLSRVEVIFATFWFLQAFLKEATALYACTVVLAETLHLPYWRPVIFPVALLAFAVSLLPPDFTSSSRLNALTMRSIEPAAAFALPLLVLGVAVLRRRQGWSHGA